MELIRFFMVSVAGLVLDLSVAWSLARLGGLPFWVAAAIGFGVAALSNYVLHEWWTFRSATRQPSVWRALRYSGVLGLTLASRVGCVAALVALWGERFGGWALLAGAGFSFVVHYLVSKRFVF